MRSKIDSNGSWKRQEISQTEFRKEGRKLVGRETMKDDKPRRFSALMALDVENAFNFAASDKVESASVEKEDGETIFCEDADER